MITENLTKFDSENKLKYRVMVDDNFHPMDESERYEYGEYATRDEAERACRKIVDDYLFDEYKPGMKTEELLGRYTGFGEDPFIIPRDTENFFSAWNYAEMRCKEICKQ